VGAQCPCFVWLLPILVFLLNCFGPLASGCCNCYCSVTWALLPVVVAIDFDLWFWHNCHCLLQLNLLSYSGMFASSCCNCFWHNHNHLLQLNLLNHSSTFSSCCFNGLLENQPGTLAITSFIWFCCNIWHICHCIFLSSLLCNLTDTFIDYQVRNPTSFVVFLHRLQFDKVKRVKVSQFWVTMRWSMQCPDTLS